MNAHTNNPRPLYRLNAAASLAGLTPELFLTACQQNQIPVTVVRLGARGIWHVDGHQLIRYLGDRAPVGLRNLF